MSVPRAIFKLCWKRAITRPGFNSSLPETKRLSCLLARESRCRRRGKILIFLVIAIPAFLGIIGLVFDAGLMMSDCQNLKHAVDAGATAGAMELLLGKTPASAEQTATSYIRDYNQSADATINVRIPPTTGLYTGRAGYVEVAASRPFNTRFMQLVGASGQQSLSARAVAGYEASTTGAAVVVLDPHPPELAIQGVPLTSAAFPALIGGLEVLGAGTVRVDGAVLVNTAWGGVDEHGNPAGDAPGPPYGISCMPLVPLTSLMARDIRVVGGVDNPQNYGSFAAGESSPLRANRLPVPDPYAQLPVPSTLSDATNVNTTLRGGVRVEGIPLIGAPTVLQPGVYEWIEVVSGQAIFSPGIYIIRNVNPDSGIALKISGGTVTANGVMFYLTNSAAYNAATGAPDDVDGEIPPVTTPTSALTPSAAINGALGGSMSPLNDPSSPFNGLIVYQRRRDYRPIVITHQNIVLGGTFAGTVYAKWGHVAFLGTSTYDVRFVGGSARLVAVANMTLEPRSLLPPARDVYLVE